MIERSALVVGMYGFGVICKVGIKGFLKMQRMTLLTFGIMCNGFIHHHANNSNHVPAHDTTATAARSPRQIQQQDSCTAAVS